MKRRVSGAALVALDYRGTEGAFLLAGHDLTLKAFADAVAAAASVSAPSIEVPPGIARLAARFDHARARLSGQSVAAPLDGVELAALPVLFDPSHAEQALGFRRRPLADTIRDALDFLRQAEAP